MSPATCLLGQPRGPPSPLCLSQFYPKKPIHTEICFLNWFKTQQAFLAQNLSREEKYHVMWFMSWSPCFQCARQVVAFLKDHKYVQLSIFVARLYYSSRPQYQQGLRSLQGAGAQVAIMTPAGESRGHRGRGVGGLGPARKDLESPERKETPLSCLRRWCWSRGVSWRRSSGERGGPGWGGR
ncbi:DNA dC-_dU-editing enzyme APOBEC-3Ca-like isoform X3 [Myotis daubentonii]|uniref:DNA dC->dU-editing enzyme APOBEC-3Ca-like isoform X3 n=1 Tax=Myotis daubentonii TaxID=98922 RepID=UPI00287342ED|nr:DNA dC->dU-editing enzyme APOBEC-3Ca-like isoform X3 [Myotis daubentonii]